MPGWRKMCLIAGIAIAWAFGAADLADAAGDETDIPKVVFFGFQLVNTSLEPTTPAEVGRINMLDGLFREQLDHSGRFKIVAIPPGLQRQIAAGAEISGCNGCERSFAKTAGGDWAAWGTVQKVSDLILNVNVYMEEADSGKMVFVKSVDIRGNTDELWRRGLDYLLQNYLLRRR